MKPKRILFLSGIQIYPAESGGQKRSQGICEALANLGHTVSIVSLTGRKQDYMNSRQTFVHGPYPGITETVVMDKFWGALGFLAYRLHVPFFWQSLLLSLGLPKPAQSILSHADLIIFDFPYLMTARRHLGGRPAVLNTHNIESELWPNKFWNWSVRKFENWAFQQADFVTFCTEREKEQVVKELVNLQGQTGVVPNGLNIKQLEKYRQSTSLRQQFRKLIGADREDTVAVFSGSLFGPNIEAFEFLQNFVDTYYHQLKAAKIRILAVGSVGKTPILNDVLVVTGRVEDVYPYLTASDIALNLVQSGSGSNVKNVEYLFFRLPIITTIAGARGLLGAETNGPVTITNREDLLEKLMELKSKDTKKMADEAYKLNKATVEIEQAILQTFSALPMFN